MESLIKSEIKEEVSQQNSVDADYDEEEEDPWKDLVGIAPDPPDRREECKYCL